MIRLGWFGQRHARIYRENPVAELVAVCDIDATLAGSTGEKLGAHACKDFEALLARPDVEAVSICLPDRQHERVARQESSRCSTSPSARFVSA